MRRRLRHTAALLALLLCTGSARSATDGSYPFLGSWVRADRTCATSPTRERVYTAKDVVSSRSKCTIRRIASGSGGYELFERCERPNEKPLNVSEIIRMQGADSMVLNRQTARLKLSRSLRFTRCASTPAASSPAKPGQSLAPRTGH